MSKREELTKLREEMLKDDLLPLKNGATNLVFGNGTPNSKILFIGEGPGFNEDQQGLPFVGAAGKLLDKTLESIGLHRKDVFVTNVVHHRPPENRDPLPEELGAYGKYLDKIIEIIKPKVIVTLGRFSMGKFLSEVKISTVHGKEKRIKWHNLNLVVVPMYHPAAALRNGNMMTSFKEDFLKLPKIIEENTKEEMKQDSLI
ncbi:MAG TPA: uracil-DNA glycosylase [Patescibacteria group bacterium]|nr:uracil-DNA glycosylase [Patescibacteria group bacterium]